MATRWTQAATILPPTIEVCGRRLLPFCLRHRVALEVIGSPILLTHLDAKASDILAAARILSSHNLAELRKPTTFSEGLWLAKMRCNKKALMTEAAKLHYYFEAQSLWPRFWEKDNTNKNTGALPWPLAVVASLVRNGATLTEAWTMPEAEAIWLHIAHCSASGADISVVSDKEWEAMEEAKKKEAAKQEAKPNTRN